MNQHEERLDPILRKYGLTKCPDCNTPITGENVGWNPGPEFGEPLPIVYIACKKCNKRLKVVHIVVFAQSLNDAIDELNNA
jgi:uncharacterized protein (UPF0212 family)